MKTKFWPAFRWQTREYGLGVATFWAVMALLELAFLTVSMVALDRGVQIEESSFTGLGVMAWFCYFVLGLAQVRADLRLGAQFGVPRRTMLGATWLAVAATGAGLALALEALIVLGRWMLGNESGVYLLDIYQVLYLQDFQMVLSPAQHLASAVFNLCGMLGAFGAGAALSLVLWHCTRVRWVVLICLALPALMGSSPFSFAAPRSAVRLSIITRISCGKKSARAAPFSYVAATTLFPRFLPRSTERARAK